MTSPVVKVSGLDYEVGGRSIFKGLDFEAAPGRITAVMGPSGTGKTTLLRLITGQSNPTRGRVEVFGQDVAQLDKPGLYSLRRRMGMLFQNGAKTRIGRGVCDFFQILPGTKSFATSGYKNGSY